jgi:hypothetical protein
VAATAATLRQHRRRGVNGGGDIVSTRNERPQLLPRNNSRGSFNGRNGHGCGSCSNGAAAAAMSATMASKRNDDGSHSCSTGGGSRSTSGIASAPAAPAAAAGTPAATAAAAGRGERGKPPLPPSDFFSYLHLHPLYIDVGYLYSTYQVYINNFNAKKLQVLQLPLCAWNRCCGGQGADGGGGGSVDANIACPQKRVEALGRPQKRTPDAGGAAAAGTGAAGAGGAGSGAGGSVGAAQATLECILEY